MPAFRGSADRAYSALVKDVQRMSSQKTGGRDRGQGRQTPKAVARKNANAKTT